MIIRVLGGLIAAASLVAVPAAQSDLDQLMQRALARRAENWKTLQHYVLEEKETFQMLGPGAVSLFGFRNEYSWFPRDGVFIRSPVKANGVTIDDEARARAEMQWLERERRRERRRAEREPAKTPPDEPPAPADTGEAVTRLVEPQFVSAAYFLRFTFESGQYALVAREQFEGRDALRIEYYPTALFSEGRARPNRRIRERDPDTTTKMNKTSLVTFWVDPAEAQILSYDFENVGLDFLPGRSIVRVDALRASMRMGQPFAGVWLPRSIEMRFRFGTAMGDLDAHYTVDYHDYRLATVTTRVR